VVGRSREYKPRAIEIVTCTRGFADCAIGLHGRPTGRTQFFVFFVIFVIFVVET
jgi:hypothetical protein